MKTYKELKKIVDQQSELSLDKPDSVTSEEWAFYNQMELLQNELQRAKNAVLDCERKIETLNALNGIY